MVVELHNVELNLHFAIQYLQKYLLSVPLGQIWIHKELHLLANEILEVLDLRVNTV